MNIFKKIANNLMRKSAQSINTVQSGFVGQKTPSYQRDYFDNIFDNAVALAKGFAKIEPYLVNDKGMRIKAQNNILDIINNPLEGISNYQFRKMLAIMSSTHDEYYILIHTKDNNFLAPPTQSNMSGFEIIQELAVSKYGDLYNITTSSGSIGVSKQRLMRMTDILDPFDLTRGYSPMRAVKKWAQLDDFIIEYQSGLFLNGAVPQGIFDICATKPDYGVIVNNIKRTMTGNSSSGVLFNHIPISSAGVVQQPTITWRPIASTNKDLQSDTLLTNNTKKMDGYFGVPQEIRGYLQNSNYASVRIAEYVMVEYGVRDLAMAIWSKFTSELIRCTGGFNAAISFNLDTPIVAAEELAKAKTDSTNIANIFSLVNKGYTVKSAIAVLGLPERYNNLGEPPVVDKPEAQDSGEGDDIPEPVISEKALIAKVTKPTFKQPDVDLSKWNSAVYDAAIAAQKTQIDAAIAEIKTKKANESVIDVPDGQYYYNNDDQLFADISVALLVALMASGGKNTDEANRFLATAGITATLSAFTAGDKKLARLVNSYTSHPSQASKTLVIEQFNQSKTPLISEYRERLKSVAESYNAETAAKIRSTLDNALTNGVSREDLVDQLKELVSDGRARRLADSEVHHIDNTANLHTLQRLQQETGKSMEKSAYSRTGTPCPFCEYQIGTWIPVDDNFASKGDTMLGTDGSERVNDFVDIGDADFHPFCDCGLEARFV